MGRGLPSPFHVKGQGVRKARCCPNGGAPAPKFHTVRAGRPLPCTPLRIPNSVCLHEHSLPSPQCRTPAKYPAGSIRTLRLGPFHTDPLITWSTQMPQSRPFPDLCCCPHGPPRAAVSTHPSRCRQDPSESPATSTLIRHPVASTRVTPSSKVQPRALYSAAPPLPRSPASSTRTPKPVGSTPAPSPQPCLLPPTQSRDMSPGSPEDRYRQVGLRGHRAGAWPGLPPALSSRRGLASATGHLGSATGARTAPDVVLT